MMWNGVHINISIAATVRLLATTKLRQGKERCLATTKLRQGKERCLATTKLRQGKERCLATCRLQHMSSWLFPRHATQHTVAKGRSAKSRASRGIHGSVAGRMTRKSTSVSRAVCCFSAVPFGFAWLL